MGWRAFSSAAVAAVRGWLGSPAGWPTLAADPEPDPDEARQAGEPLHPDERAFLRVILADPADSLPRLVYADWLEERDDPRGEFLRLATRYRDELRGYSRDRADILARLEELRPAMPAAWRTAFDVAGRYYLVWPKRVRDQLARLDLREPLRAVHMTWGWWSPPTAPATGDYVYVLTLVEGRPFLVSRMRVAAIGRAEQFRRRLARVRHFPWRGAWGVAALGDEGLPIRLGPPLPDEVLRTFEFHTKKNRRWRLKLDPDGRVLNHGCLAGGCRLTDATALRLDALLHGWA